LLCNEYNGIGDEIGKVFAVNGKSPHSENFLQ